MRVPRAIDWLNDNAPPNVTNQTRALGPEGGFLVRTRPADSPESNAMAEAFVKSFKREYVYLAEIDDAKSVMRELVAWFEDYKDNDAHRGLGMRSPREFRITGNTA